MRANTLLVCKPFLMSTKSTPKHAQISNTIWWRVDPFSIDLVKKKYKHAHTLTTVTTPSSHTLGHDWTHIAQMTVIILTRNMISSPSQRSTKQICRVPVKIVLPSLYTQSQPHSPHENRAQPTPRCSLHPEHALDCSPLWIREFWLLQSNHLISIKASVSWNHVSWDRWESNCSHAR